MKGWFLFLFAWISVIFADEFVLSLNNNEQYAISEIVNAMGENNFIMLTPDASRLRGLGKSIEHVRPLQFLAYILMAPDLKANLKRMSKRFMNWRIFMDGLGGNLEKEFNQGILLPQLDGFYQLVGGSKEQIERYVYDQDWEGFVKSFF